MVFWSLAGSLHTFDSEGERISHWHMSDERRWRQGLTGLTYWSINMGDRWFAATNPTYWPKGINLADLQDKWQPLWGDRRQEVRIKKAIRTMTMILPNDLAVCVIPQIIGRLHWFTYESSHG